MSFYSENILHATGTVVSRLLPVRTVHRSPSCCTSNGEWRAAALKRMLLVVYTTLLSHCPTEFLG